VFRKIITRELQEWHKQQVFKYKTVPDTHSIQSEAINERAQSPSQTLTTSSTDETTRDTMIVSELPSSDDLRTLCSSAFIVNNEVNMIPSSVARSVSISYANDNLIHAENARLEVKSSRMHARDYQ
jgi:hypothetical protein